ncbi:NAD-dependent epimerase/dehydratase family protein [Arthrobacter livingstonensis]|uniref:NAD-dependent epimerase/dehydratase family protein n=1 Tax=Arthrobacter livingstonensis TaxID=670078 RepID=UPI001FE8A7FE|nr:NAD-dependent epimerase/dehydratase family protein [Arthrobacter livingstonensis]
MRVFLAGGTGVVGRRLVPQLLARGHQVTATTTSSDKLALLQQLGAEAVVMDGLDAVSVGEAVARARPDVIVHQMTGLSAAHAGKPDLRHPDRFFAATNRLRTEGTDHLLAAAEAAGVSHVVAQGFGAFNAVRTGGWVNTGEDPLDPDLAGAPGVRDAIHHLEDVMVKAGGTVLRYGSLYGPGAIEDQVTLVRKRQYPLVGGGTGYNSWVHLDDAAGATVLAVEQRAQGVFNIVDDEPAPGRRVAALSGAVCGRETAHAAPRLAGQAAGRGHGGYDDRGARLLQRQGEARTRLGTALPVVAPGLQGRAGVSRVQEFEALRPLLFAISYRILGSVGEAEDAVQETWLRFDASSTLPTSVKAFLSAAVTRISIDVLRSARVRRETYVGQWFPEPLVNDPYDDPARAEELADSVSMAALLLLERLSQLERAVFVLREVFAFDFPEIAATVERSEAACRPLAVRARRHMEAERPRFDADRKVRDTLAARFFDALRDGDLAGLQELLAAEVQLVSDSGGKAPQGARESLAQGRLPGRLPRYSHCSSRLEGLWSNTRSTASQAPSSATGTTRCSTPGPLTSSTGSSRRSVSSSTPTSSGTSVRWRMPGRSSARRTGPAGRVCDPKGRGSLQADVGPAVPLPLCEMDDGGRDRCDSGQEAVAVHGRGPHAVFTGEDRNAALQDLTNPTGQSAVGAQRGDGRALDDNFDGGPGKARGRIQGAAENACHLFAAGA